MNTYNESFSIAHQAWMEENYEAALAFATKGLKQIREIREGGSDLPEWKDMRFLMMIGDCSLELGDYRKSRLALREVFRIVLPLRDLGIGIGDMMTQVYSPEQLQKIFARACYGIGYAADRLGDYQEAIHYSQRAVVAYSTMKGRGDASLAALRCLAAALHHANRPKEAAREYLCIAEICSSPSEIREALGKAGYILEKIGDVAGAGMVAWKMIRFWCEKHFIGRIEEDVIGGMLNYATWMDYMAEIKQWLSSDTASAKELGEEALMLARKMPNAGMDLVELAKVDIFELAISAFRTAGLYNRMVEAAELGLRIEDLTDTGAEKFRKAIQDAQSVLRAERICTNASEAFNRRDFAQAQQFLDQVDDVDPSMPEGLRQAKNELKEKIWLHDPRNVKHHARIITEQLADENFEKADSFYRDLQHAQEENPEIKQIGEQIRRAKVLFVDTWISRAREHIRQGDINNARIARDHAFLVGKGVYIPMAFADLDFDIGTLVAEAAERQAKRLAERGYFVDAEKSLKEIIEEEKIDKPTRDRIVTFIKSLHQRSHEASQKYERLISQSIIKHQWDRAKELLLQATNQGYSEKLKKYRKIVDTYFQMCKQLEAAKGQLSKDPKSTLRIARDILRSKLAAPLHEMARALEKEAVSKLATSQVKQARLELKQVREHLSKRQYADAAQLIEKAMSYPYASELRSEAKQLKEEFWPLWQRISNNYREDWSTVSIVMGLMLGLAGIVGLLFLPAINFLMALWLGVIVFLAVAGTTEVLYAGSFFIHDGDVHYSSFVIGGWTCFGLTLILKLSGTNGWISWIVGLVFSLVAMGIAMWKLDKHCHAIKLAPKE